MVPRPSVTSAPPSATNGTGIRGTPKIEAAFRQAVAGRGRAPRSSPCVEIPVDGDDLLREPGAAQREGRRDVPHPDVVDRRFDHGDISAGGKFPPRFARPGRGGPAGEPAHSARSVCTTSLSSRLTLLAALPHSGWTAQAIQQQSCGSHSAGMRVDIAMRLEFIFIRETPSWLCVP